MLFSAEIHLCPRQGNIIPYAGHRASFNAVVVAVDGFRVRRLVPDIGIGLFLKDKTKSRLVGC